MTTVTYYDRRRGIYSKATTWEQLFEDLAEVEPNPYLHGKRGKHIKNIPRKDPQFGVYGVFIPLRTHVKRTIYGGKGKFLIPTAAPYYLYRRLPWFNHRALPWEDPERLVMKFFRMATNPKGKKEMINALGNDYYDKPPKWIIETRTDILKNTLLQVLDKYIDLRVAWMKKNNDMIKYTEDRVVFMAKLITEILLEDYAAVTRIHISVSELKKLVQLALKDRYGAPIDIDAFVKALGLITKIGIIYQVSPNWETGKFSKFFKSMKNNIVVLSPNFLVLIFVTLDYFGYAFRSDAAKVDRMLRRKKIYHEAVQAVEDYTQINLPDPYPIHPKYFYVMLGLSMEEAQRIVDEYHKRAPFPPPQPDLTPLKEELMKRASYVGRGKPRLFRQAMAIMMMEVFEAYGLMVKVPIIRRIVQRFNKVSGGLLGYVKLLAKHIKDWFKWLKKDLKRTSRKVYKHGEAIKRGIIVKDEEDEEEENVKELRTAMDDEDRIDRSAIRRVFSRLRIALGSGRGYSNSFNMGGGGPPW